SAQSLTFDSEITMIRYIFGIFALSVALQMSPVSAGVISYSLSDKAPGAIANPDYGLRLDDLFGSANTNWTFSFDDPGASMTMDIDTDNARVHIHGTVVGGRDVGSSWANPARWELDFTYDTNLTITDASTGFWSLSYVGDNAANFGTLTLLDDINVDGVAGSDQGKFLDLGGFHGGSFFDHGSKGPYVSAWLQSDRYFGGPLARPNGGGCCMDFGFKAARVPEPSVLALFAAGLAGFGLTRRRTKT
ncbi:MAG: PEP-CTERM sorting domain-containing protein, partial [Pseudomonadota bacterium]